MTDVFAPFTLPLRREGDAEIVDAAGETVLVIDPDRHLQDDQATAIADHVFALAHRDTEQAPWVVRVMAAREEGDGFWQACSGCQESVDGHVSTRDYPYSAAFGCQTGGGCSECGGLGVKWDTTDYEAMASYILATEKQSDILHEIGDERYRQVEVEAFKTDRDDAYTGSELAKAAAAYTLSACGFQPDAAREMWPSTWSPRWWKPTEPRRDLIKAGALIVAEIERRDRAASTEESA